MSAVSELLLRDRELSNNKSKRVLLCLCIDNSASMTRGGVMGEVNRGIERFFERTDRNSLSRDAADICIVAFGDKAELVCDFGPLQRAMNQVKRQPIRATGAGTVLAAGVTLALERLDHHLKELASVNNNAYIPWLIIISDGDSTEAPAAVERAAAQVRRRVQAGALRTLCLSIGEGSRSLAAFTADGRVSRLEDLKVADFFDMLSRSVTQASQLAIQQGGVEINPV